jgi:amino acid adenylation domain-containing protein
MNILEQLKNLPPTKRELYKLLLDRYDINVSQLPIGKRETTETPLSYIQQSLLFLNQLMPESPAYNVENAIRIKGSLNVSILEQTLKTLLQRHDILRSAYKIKDNTARQYVCDDVEINLDVIDLSHMEVGAAFGEATRQATEVSIRPFDLSTGQVLRTALYKLAENDYLFLMVIHHIAVDGYSEGILATELKTIYTALSENRAIELPSSPIRYGDYSVWERARIDNQLLNHQVDYWTQHLKNTPDLLEISSDRPRPGIVSFRGYTRDFKIDPDLYKQLQNLSSQMGTTLFITLLAAYQILLYRYSRQQKFVVATSVSIRNRPELEHLIGCLANLIVIKADFNRDISFEEFTRHLTSDALDAFSNQDLPFETLVEHLHPKRDISYNPIFQTSFDLHQESFTDNLKINNLDITGLRLQKLSSKYDLGLAMVAGNVNLTGSVEYNSDLFDLSTIDSMLHAFKELINLIVTKPHARISELTALTEAEKELIFNDWSSGSATHFDNTLSIQRMFEKQLDKYGKKTAVICNGQELSYDELNDRANQLAHYLISVGVTGETKVAICLEPSINILVAVLGVLKSGTCYIPVDPLYPQDRIQYMLSDSATSYIISQSETTDSISFPNTCTLVLLDKYTDGINVQPKQPPIIPQNPDKLAYIIYTSGSTGKPKGVMVHHHAVVNFLSSMAKVPGLDHDDKLLAVTTLSFDIAVLELLLPIITGATVIIATREQATDGNKLTSIIKQKNINVIQATPATWRLLLNSGWQGNTNLRALCGGEALQQDLVRNLLPKTAELWNMYGPTETTIWSTCYKVTATDKPALIGKPIDNTQCYVLTDSLQPVPAGMPGELYIGGAGVTKGYLNRDELTAERFIDNPFNRLRHDKLYRTGDRVKYNSEGNLEYIQRIDNQVKVRGFRIELGEIESVIGELDNIAQTCVVVREEKVGDSRIYAYFAPAPGKSVTSTEIRKKIRQKLPDYMIPQFFIEMDQLPQMPNGKIDKKALPLTIATLPHEAEYIAPRDNKEKILVKIWADVIDISPDQISIHDDFFEIGGTSLIAMQMFNSIEQSTGRRFPISMLYRASTVRQLAALLNDNVDENSYIEAGTDQHPAKVNSQDDVTNGSLRPSQDADIGSSTVSPAILTSIVPIQTDGHKTPLFFMHGEGGNVLMYRSLAKRLGPEQPVYGLESVGLNQSDFIHKSIEEMGSHYADEIMTTQVEGPYLVGGYCMGGSIALEVARNLKQRGKKVSCVILIDSMNNSTVPNERPFFSFCYLHLQVARFHWQYIWQLDQGKRINYMCETASSTMARARRLILRMLKRGGAEQAYMEADMNSQLNTRLDTVWQANESARRSYVPTKYEGKLVLFKQYARFGYSRELGWEEVAVDGVDIEFLPAYPVTFLNEPYVASLASSMKQYLDRL